MLDPKNIQKAVTEFMPKRPPKFHELLAAKDWIAELRGKRASYVSIADLLTQHCLPISKSAIAMFCHEVLGEAVHSRRRPARRRVPAASIPGGENTAGELPKPAPATLPRESENASARPRGPHIAKVELLKTIP